MELFYEDFNEKESLENYYDKFGEKEKLLMLVDDMEKIKFFDEKEELEKNDGYYDIFVNGIND